MKLHGRVMIQFRSTLQQVIILKFRQLEHWEGSLFPLNRRLSVSARYAEEKHLFFLSRNEPIPQTSRLQPGRYINYTVPAILMSKIQTNF